jgi:hypothetical protein
VGAMRSGSKNDQRGSGRSVQGTDGWGQPSGQEAIPRQGPGFLAFLPGTFEKVVPELAQLDAQGVAAVDQDTSQPANFKAEAVGCIPVCAGIRADRPAAGPHSPGSSERATEVLR